MQSVCLGVASAITLDTTAIRLRHTEISASPTRTCWTKDKVHNARSVLRDLRNPAIGEKVWTRFKPSREDSLWNFDELAEVFDSKFSENNARWQLALEFKDLVDMLHGTQERQSPTVRTC